MTLTPADIEALGYVAAGEGGIVEPEVRFRLLMLTLIERHGNEWELTDKGAAALDDSNRKFFVRKAKILRDGGVQNWGCAGGGCEPRNPCEPCFAKQCLNLMENIAIDIGRDEERA